MKIKQVEANVKHEFSMKAHRYAAKAWQAEHASGEALTPYPLLSDTTQLLMAKEIIKLRKLVTKLKMRDEDPRWT